MNQEPTVTIETTEPEPSKCTTEECTELSEPSETVEAPESSEESEESEVDLEDRPGGLSKIIYYDNTKITKSYEIENFLYVFCLALVFFYALL
jgi:hypothetical protein